MSDRDLIRFCFDESLRDVAPAWPANLATYLRALIRAGRAGEA